MVLACYCLVVRLRLGYSQVPTEGMEAKHGAYSTAAWANTATVCVPASLNGCRASL
ncbi:hypothetical protein BJX63DRAFT_379801 [Aspergillus granulosus]|uniref:Uncharacterized protein n=1 Tax=Aspergillus granulosus TaxID=176169 RepID=A0ABR4HZ50_9EURO